jgi:TRAP-type C4-dicarboxylate transport system substrate-binding protein
MLYQIKQDRELAQQLQDEDDENKEMEFRKSLLEAVQAKQKEEDEMVKKYESVGVTVIRDIDRNAFRTATAKVYDNYQGWTPGIRDKVRGIITK